MSTTRKILATLLIFSLISSFTLAFLGTVNWIFFWIIAGVGFLTARSWTTTSSQHP